MKIVSGIPPRYNPQKAEPEIKPIKVCPMCGRLFLQRHRSKVYCKECAAERDKECKRKWAREHPEKMREYARNYHARHVQPVPTKGRVWDLVFGYIEDESFEYGAFSMVIFEEDKAYASRYAEIHGYR